MLGINGELPAGNKHNANFDILRKYCEILPVNHILYLVKSWLKVSKYYEHDCLSFEFILSVYFHISKDPFYLQIDI